ncbi:MAG: glycosyltransferase [Deltaproteobacteria bacterium]|nr:glycosyltransferase [Deltaproteobacteria bacterium]
MRGGEKCLEALCELFPDADLYTLIYVPERISSTIRGMTIKTSWINNLPGVNRYYRYCLPLFPAAIESFDLRDYDLIVSSSHCVAKGAVPHRAIHISYVHSPMRYVWDMHDAYFDRNSSPVARTGMALWRNYIQRWDVLSAERVHFFVAISNHIARKIRTVYGREAAVIYPPVDTKSFYIGEARESYYLVVSALVPYKKVDIAIEAFNRLKLPLKIAGEGPLRKTLEKKAGPTVEFLGWVNHNTLADLYASCQALVFPGEEDFGIVPLEAQASGRPVIGYGKGGILETVVPLNPQCPIPGVNQPTGIFFYEPSADALMETVKLFERNLHRFESKELRDHAMKFDRAIFKTNIRSFIEEKCFERRRLD